MKKAALFLVMMLVPLSAAAQEVADSFAELNRQQVLEAGDTVLITFDLSGEGDYRVLEVEVDGLTDSAITVVVDSLPGGRTVRNVRVRPDGKTQIEIPENGVRQILRPSSGMSRVTGGLIGGAVGAGGALAISLACAYGGCDELSYEGFVGLWIALPAGGAAVGALVASPTDEELLFVSDGPAQPALTFSVSPILGKGRKGVLLSFRW